MPPPTQNISVPPGAWPLIAHEIQVMRDYSCHDGEPGLSLEDVQFLQTSNPVLFQETADLYRDLRGRFRGEGLDVGSETPAGSFLSHFSGKGHINLWDRTTEALGSYLNSIGRPLISRPPNYRPLWASRLTANPVDVFGTFGWNLSSEINLSAMKASLLNYFKVNDALLREDEVSVRKFVSKPDKFIPFPYLYQIEFFPNQDCRPSKGSV